MIHFLKLFFGTLIISHVVFGQSGKIVVGTIEDNFTDFKPDKNNSCIATMLFCKNNNAWGIFEAPSYAKRENFNVYFKGKKVGTVVSKIDTPPNRRPYFWYPSKSNCNQIPKIGRKSYEFAGMGGEKCYRPLLISNSLRGSQKNTPRYRKPNKDDSLLVITYLLETAKKLNLGNIGSPTDGIIKAVNRVLIIAKDCYLIDADVNLNMFCYKEKIPFNADSSFFLGNTEKHVISQTKETPGSFFLVNKSKVSYVDYGLKYLDSGDFDNDGYDEIFFRMDKYNYKGYLMITDKWDNFITYDWSYH